MELTMAARRQVTQAQLAKWPKASKAEKSAILDAVCEVTGWHRDHARKAIRTALADVAAGGPQLRRQREPVRVYGEDVVALLTRCWAVLDGPTGKRLHPALPAVLANLNRHGHLTGTDPAWLSGCWRCRRPRSIAGSPARRRSERVGGSQADQPYPAGVDAEGVDPDEDLAGVERR